MLAEPAWYVIFLSTLLLGIYHFLVRRQKIQVQYFLSAPLLPPASSPIPFWTPSKSTFLVFLLFPFIVLSILSILCNINAYSVYSFLPFHIILLCLLCLLSSNFLVLSLSTSVSPCLSILFFSILSPVYLTFSPEALSFIPSSSTFSLYSLIYLSPVSLSLLSSNLLALSSLSFSSLSLAIHSLAIPSLPPSITFSIALTIDLEPFFSMPLIVSGDKSLLLSIFQKTCAHLVLHSFFNPFKNIV
jgi:hypothetical protein